MQVEDSIRSENPLVSVITPVGPAWNRDFLSEARDSLLKTQASFEWILCCDRSDPGEVSAVVNPTRLPNITVIGGFQDHGIAKARNLALQQATGKWIYAFDSDDLTLGAIDSLLEAAKDEGTVWAAGTAQDVDEMNTQVIYIPDPSLAPFDKKIPGNGFIDSYDINGVYPFLCSGATLIQTNIVRECGGWNETLREVGEDVALLARVSRKYVGAWTGTEPILSYRKHPASITASGHDSELDQLAWQIARQH